MSALKASVQEQLNKFIESELNAAQLYLAGSIWFQKANYRGISKYLYAESEALRTHTKLIIDYVLKREDGDVKVPAIEYPSNVAWERATDIFTATHAFEVANLQHWEQLIQLAKSESDNVTELFAADQIRTQVERVDKSRSTLEKVKAYGHLHGLMYHLDKMI